ncbi:MAG: hypothetical protein ABI573_00825 [Chloroflexota bacterium]
MAAQPAQQKGSPMWNVGEPTISISHVTQLKGWMVLKRRMSILAEMGADPGRSAVEGAPR